MNKAATYLFVIIIAVWMLGGAYGHFFRPDFFYAILPESWPKAFVVYTSGVPELMIGLAILFPRTRALAGLGFAVLCLCFLPLHVWDLFRENPAFAPQSVAITRIFIQFVLIWMGYQLWRQRKLH